MSSTNSGKRYLLIAGKILILLIVVIGALQSGTPASYIDPYGFLFVLVGGVALMMISFPGAEIWRAFRHAAGGSGDDAEIRNSAHFWEAAGRGFWILGGLSSVLSHCYWLCRYENGGDCRHIGDHTYLDPTPAVHLLWQLACGDLFCPLLETLGKTPKPVIGGRRRAKRYARHQSGARAGGLELCLDMFFSWLLWFGQAACC